jgi:chromate transporter
MATVYPRSAPPDRPFPLASFLRASTLHVGAAAAAASLREDLADHGSLTISGFDEAYAIARLTPGTNLLAMYTLLGDRLAGWRGATTALSAGIIVPAAIAGVVAAAYVSYAEFPLAAKAMQGARTGALAVLLWGAVRLLRPQFAEHRARAVIVAIAALITTLTHPVPQIALLIVAGGIGAVFLRRDA